MFYFENLNDFPINLQKEISDIQKNSRQVMKWIGWKSDSEIQTNLKSRQPKIHTVILIWFKR